METVLPEPSITDHYLPSHRLGAVEALLLKKGGSLLAPIYTADEIEASTALQLCASPIDFCIRNLTHRFPDGPTYFAITKASAVNAMIARFPGFQCVVIAQGVHIRTSVLLVSLLTHAPLQNFIQGGVEPDEPVTAPTRSREEALNHLSEHAGQITDQTRSLTASLMFLLLYLLTAHEIGHLALGHLDRRSDGNMDEVEEVNESKAESRAQEWDADGFAFAATLYLTGSEFRLLPVWRDLIPDTHAALRVISVVAYALFTVMDSMGPQDRLPEQRTHPRPLVRVGLATLTLTALMHDFGSVTGDVVMDTSQAAIRAVEITLHDLAGGVMERDLATQLGDELESEMHRLISVLRDDLWPLLDRSRLSDLYWARGLSIPPTL